MVYADNAATTKMSRTAIDAMLPYMDHSFRGNVDLSGGYGPPVGHGFLRHVHHPGAALLVEMGQFSHGSASDLIHGPGRVAGMLCQVMPLGLMQDAP